MTGVKSLFGDVLHSRPSHQACGEDIVLVGPLGLLDTVGGHEDRAGELAEFLELVLPRCSEMTVEVGVLLEARISMGGQHLTVGVNGDSLAFRLLQDRFHVLQVVA